MTTNRKRLSNKEMRKADEFVKAMFNGNENLVESLLGVKPMIIGSQEDILKELQNNESDLFKYIKKLSTKIKENDLHKEKNIQEKEYQVQKGDKVLILDSPEGIKNVKGVVVDEVKGTQQFLVKLSELNALYVDKDNVQIIKKKQNIEEINKLKDKIVKTQHDRQELIDSIKNIGEKIHNLEKSKIVTQEKLSIVSKVLEQHKQQLEQLEGANNEI